MKTTLTIPAGWKERLLKSHEAFCRDIPKVDPAVFSPAFLDNYDASYNLLQPFVENGQRPRILEIGSGFGTGLANNLKLGLDVVGVEPGEGLGFEGRYDMARELLEANGAYQPGRLLQGIGENLPIEDNAFDIVFSQVVLEHVQDVDRCVSEALRVAKPGGRVLIELPNYQAWSESHYMTPWLPVFPFVPKRIAKWWVKYLFGRADYYIDEMNFVTPSYFRKLAATLDSCAELRIVLFLYQRLREIKLIEWIQWKYYVHLNNTYDGLRLSLSSRAEKLLLGVAMRLFEVAGLCSGFRVTLIKNS